MPFHKLCPLSGMFFPLGKMQPFLSETPLISWVAVPLVGAPPPLWLVFKKAEYLRNNLFNSLSNCEEYYEVNTTVGLLSWLSW